MILLMHIFAKIMKRKVVVLLHYDGDVTYHTAQDTPFGMVCRVRGIKCLLLPGGSIRGPSWVEEWRLSDR